MSTFSEHWDIMDGDHANHKIKIKYTVYNKELEIQIQGPRTGTINKKEYVQKKKKVKVTRKLPFLNPTPTQIADKAYENYVEAENRIDKAIAEHAKKHEEDYQ